MIPIVQKDIQKNNQISLIRSGEFFFETLAKMINEAQIEIHLQTYILEDDVIGSNIIKNLIIAANRGVEVYILLDGFGSSSLTKDSISKLKKNKIHFRFFSPILSASSFNFSRRLHHKIVITDSMNILIGGINIAQKYHGSEIESPWLDYAILIKNSSLAQSLQELCLEIYNRKWNIDHRKISMPFHEIGLKSVSFLQNDWLKRKKQIHNAYIKNIENAKDEIIIMASYFLPGKKIISALKKASENNVDIKLILSGISDVEWSKKASNYLYGKLLGFNIKIYEWNKSVLHAKTAVIDKNWTTIGSYNLNNLSAYASIEMNIAIESSDFGLLFSEQMQEIIDQCENITFESLKIKNNRQTRFINWGAYWTARILMTITTYLPYKRFLKIN